MRWLVTAVVVVLGALPVFGQEADLARGRSAAEAFLDNKLAQLWEDMAPPMQQVFGTMEGLAAFREQLTQDIGEESKVLDETLEPADGFATYIRTSRWTRAEAPVLLQMGIADDGEIVGLTVKPKPVLADSRYLGYETRTPLRLPFEGQWYVVWGGRTLEQNYHAADRAQRFAIDVLISRNGVTHTGDASELENYYCWGQPILAPAAGTVVSASDDLPDNPIGSTDATHPAGNHVVLDFGNGEYGFLAHMREGSIRVAAGDTVAPDQELGRCGNSGNTSEPHLHFHLQTTPDLGSGEGLPAFFNRYLADDRPVERGEPLAGQFIRPD
jgi:hypothetical protein